MKLARIAMLASLLSLGSAVQAAEPLPLQNEFSAEAIAWVQEDGPATVSGKAFITLEDGTSKGCEGFNMELLPVTPYSTERIEKTYGNTQQGQILISQNPPRFTPDPKAYHELSRKTQCKDGHQFRFDDVPLGEYYVMAFIFWPSETQEGVYEGGAAMHRLTVASDGDHRVSLDAAK